MRNPGLFPRWANNTAFREIKLKIVDDTTCVGPPRRTLTRCNLATKKNRTRRISDRGAWKKKSKWTTYCAYFAQWGTKCECSRKGRLYGSTHRGATNRLSVNASLEKRARKNELFDADGQIISGSVRYAKLSSNRRATRPNKNNI